MAFSDNTMRRREHSSIDPSEKYRHNENNRRAVSIHANVSKAEKNIFKRHCYKHIAVRGNNIAQVA